MIIHVSTSVENVVETAPTPFRMLMLRQDVGPAPLSEYEHPPQLVVQFSQTSQETAEVLLGGRVRMRRGVRKVEGRIVDWGGQVIPWGEWKIRKVGEDV